MNLRLSDQDETILLLTLPNSLEVKIPTTEAGMRVLTHVLRENRRFDREGLRKSMGTPAVPLQQMVDKWLLAGSPVQRLPPGKGVTRPELTLEDLLS